MKSIEAKYDKLLVKIAKNIKRVRKERKLSQPAMVNFGFDVRNYQRLEAGKHSPSLFTLHKLAVVFKVDMSEFFV
ncbi:MAG: helix-turn-helix domain-containing protein [Bdellovibrionales bacterium]|nr:helix-turn-helix domain-containing protein [Bdellovibrionales bacterium]